MKIDYKQYARVLYELTQGKNEKEIKEMVKKFTELLLKNNDAALTGKISEYYSKIYNEYEGRLEANICTVNKLDKDMAEAVKKYLEKISGAKKIVISEKLDEKILGGIIIRYGDKIIDGSLKTKLSELKNQLIK